MLKSRIITAVVLIPLVIASIFFLPPFSFFSLAMILILMAGWEWSRLVELTPLWVQITFLLALTAVLIAFVFIPIYFVIALGLIWWIVAIILLAIYPRGSHLSTYNRLIPAAMGFFVLIPFWIGLIILQGFSPAIMMYCLILIWAADIAAYFVGRKWGRHKLAPLISPGKTQEGVLAGFIAAAIIAVLGIWVLDIQQGQRLTFFAFSLLGGGILTVVGDLFESMVKRQFNVKDSGTILPGHGGVLDRVDSMTTAIPFFALVFPLLLSN